MRMAPMYEYVLAKSNQNSSGCISLGVCLVEHALGDAHFLDVVGRPFAKRTERIAQRLPERR
jgi:hypothetical protein